ncbi:MAG: hypothetical protein IT436_13765 [Phycisphaerales bacterium]|nr:hypothetical protein [Phycisphaerales bacterium]
MSAGARGIAGLVLAAGVLAGGPARAVSMSPPAQPWPTSPRPAEDATPARTEPGPALPGLDDLLGLPGEGGGGVEPARDPSRDALDQQLDLEAPGDPFEQAVELMGRSAVRLVDARDAGLGTQRIQEEVIRKLDKMIDEAQKSQQQQSSKSKSRSQSQQQQQQRQETQAQTKSGDNTGQTNVPGRQDGPRREGAPPSTAAWGNLPEHVREALMQGFSDRFSSLYQSMTEAYYRKLAEEPKK